MNYAAWERPAEYDDPPDPPEEDCLDCGMCESCIQRSIATAEEMNDVKPRQPHPMLHRLLGIADAMEEYGFGVGDPPDAPFVREAAYELEHLKRLNESTERGYETVLKVADRLQAERDALLTAANAAAAVLPGLEVRSWPPGHRMKSDALELLRTAIAKAEAS